MNSEDKESWTVSDLIGRKARAIFEILNSEGSTVALQVCIADDSALVVTVWTDWSLRFERRQDSAIPDYLWPPLEHFRRNMVEAIPGAGLEILSFTLSKDNDVLVASDIEFENCRIRVRSAGGEIILSREEK